MSGHMQTTLEGREMSSEERVAALVEETGISREEAVWRLANDDLW